MVTVLDLTVTDMTAMVSMNDMHLLCVGLCWGCSNLLAKLHLDTHYRNKT